MTRKSKSTLSPDANPTDVFKIVPMQTRKETAKTVPFMVRLPLEIQAKLKAASYHDGETMMDIVARAISTEINRMEKQRGEPYPIPKGK
jgi:hypothetical protein